MESIRYWDYGEQGVGQHCIRECKEIIKFFKEKNKNKINVLDIGANVGKVYDFLSQELNVENHIMYEASPILSKYMEEKYSGDISVKINNYAVSNCDGDVFIPENIIKNVLDENKYEYFENLGIQSVNSIQGTPIKQLSILDILEKDKDFYEKIDLIKIDTENFDYLILEKMISFIKKMDEKPLICFEHNYMLCYPIILRENAEKIYNSYINECGYNGLNFNELSGDCFLYPTKSIEKKLESNIIVKNYKKTKIRVHNPCNEFTRYYRNYNYFWDKFTDFLKLMFDVDENRYYENAHKERFNITLEKGTVKDLSILECEYIIENLENGEFVIMSVSDIFSHAILNEKNNPYLKMVLVSQFLPESIKIHTNENFHKYHPWTYFQSGMIDLENYYNKRCLISPKKNELYFRGTSLEDRVIINFIDKNIITPFNPISENQYFDELINHKLALSVDGRGEFCYRDIECFAIGVPIIRFEYKSKFNSTLIPNYHYISIPRPKDMGLYRLGTEEHGKMLVDKYYEVINDEKYLNFISNNARNYYVDNCSLHNNIKNTFDILNLSNWL